MTNTPLHVVDHDQDPPNDEPVCDSALQFSRDALNVQVPIETIRAQRTPGAAFGLACIASGLDDKEIYTEVGINQGYFSNIRAGLATLKAEKEPAFCKRVGNMVYPEWRAYQHGCTLVPIGRYEELLAAERKAKELELRLDTAMQMIGRARAA